MRQEEHKGEGMAERERVENPFTLGPSTDTRRYSPSLDTRVKPQEQITVDKTGTEIVDTLIKFAGVAGSEYIKRTEKKIEADKAVQTSRAVQGMMPTDDATNAGYRAHAAVSIKGQALESQVRLNELAKTKMTDEQWEEVIRSEYSSFDKFMTDKYDDYAKDVELQKLGAVALRETIPQVTAAREGYKIEHEINDRMNSATDVLVNATASGMITGANPEELVNSVDTLLAPLQLTASQKDDVIINAVIVSDDQKLVEFSKSYNGDRKTSLYDRSGKIQAVDKANQSQKIADMSISYSEDLIALKDRFIGTSEQQPDMTEEEFTIYVKGRNADTNNKFMSRPQYEHIIALKQEADAGRFRLSENKKLFMNPNNSDMSHLKKEEKQAVFESLIVDNENRVQKEADALLLEGDERNEYVANGRRRYAMHMGDMSVKNDIYSDAWVADFKSLANLNVEAVLEKIDAGDGKTINVLSSKANSTIDLLDSLSPSARSAYMDKIGDSSKTIDALSHYKDMNIELPMALSKAQAETRYGKPTNFDDINKATSKVISKMGAGWIDNVPDKQERFLIEKIKRSGMDYHYPLDDRNIEMVADSYKRNWTILKDGTRVEGSAQAISSFTAVRKPHKFDDGTIIMEEDMGIAPENLNTAFKAFLELNRDVVMSKIDVLGFDFKDVFPVTNIKTGMMHLQVGNWSMPGTSVPISDLTTLSRRYKVHQEEAIIERKEARKIYDKRQSVKGIIEGI